MNLRTSAARGSMTFPRIVAPKMDVIPAQPGMKLVHPIDGLLPDEGGKWTRDQYTFRLLLDRSLVEPAPEPVAAPEEAPAPAREPDTEQTAVVADDEHDA
jgi:hypothetical protein